MITAFLVAALQIAVDPRTGQTSPPSGDTVGYWQQRVAYRITATLDEAAQVIRGRGTLWYVNNSPDTLRVMYLHQYLNAFRPRSKWAQADEREGRERFQRLRDPHYAYERFTAPVRVNGAVVSFEYPGAPDSTVVRLSLPQPLVPRDSVLVSFEWDARPSTLPRRQGRRGRHWDLAQWYPKVAVYDRGGWQFNALRPAGEFYGEFGIYDVTLIVRDDQVLAATGVPVSGDPGWARAHRGGVVRPAPNAYGAVHPAEAVSVPANHKAVRFLARDVHHFGWSASPDFRYEGVAYVRPVPRVRWRTWDTVSVHVLYRPGDDTTWGGLRVANRTVNALRWLESLFGPYAYPQMTAVHRIEGGGTEFPMLMMNGSPSQGLILHEGGHVYAYGALANNEWRSGWMDEGLTSYQTAWAQGLTPQERSRLRTVDRRPPPTGYRRYATRMSLHRWAAISLDQTLRDLLRGAEPMGTAAHEFRDFATYQSMIYDRAELMFGLLRDLLGDSLFVAFLHDYYARWTLKHVDERALRASAERVSGRDLRWFFDQWVRRTGVMDYSLERVSRAQDSAGSWLTEATVRRRGEYSHDVPVGVRTTAGWTLARAADASSERQTVRIATADEPLEVRLDPHEFTWDWDRRNDTPRRPRPLTNFDWPFLDQSDRGREVRLIRPMAWYSEPGGANVGARGRTSYLGLVDKHELGVVSTTRDRTSTSGFDPAKNIQLWARTENPYLPFISRPAMGWRAGAASLDDVLRLDVGRKLERTIGRRTMLDEYALNYTRAVNEDKLPELWSAGDTAWTLDLSSRTTARIGDSEGSHWLHDLRLLAGACGGCTYLKTEVSAARVQKLTTDARASARLYAAMTSGGIPGQRALLLSAEDPVATFDNHWWRPRGGILKQPGVPWLPLGGAALRGYHWSIAAKSVGAVNLELARRLATWTGAHGGLSVSISAFGDGALVSHLQRRTEREAEWMSDAGVGLSVRGRFYDQPLTIRLDAPFFVSQPALGIDQGRQGSTQLAPRFVLTFADIW